MNKSLQITNLGFLVPRKVGQSEFQSGRTGSRLGRASCPLGRTGFPLGSPCSESGSLKRDRAMVCEPVSLTRPGRAMRSADAAPAGSRGFPVLSVVVTQGDSLEY